MHKAPWTPRLLAMILAGIAVSFPIQIISLYGHGLSEWTAILNKLTVFNYLTIACCIVSSYYLWNCHKKSLVFLSATAAAVAWNNFLVGYIAYDYSMATTMSATGFFLSTYALLLHPDSLKMLKQQNQRWWMQAERKAMRFPTEVCNMEGLGFSTKTFDLSVSGVFVSFEDDKALKGLQVGDYCNISIQVSQYKKLRGLAKIIRYSEGNGKYPRGLGLQFEQLKTDDKKFLEQVLEGSQADITH